jgi:hypothetical protein
MHMQRKPRFVNLDMSAHGQTMYHYAAADIARLVQKRHRSLWPAPLPELGRVIPAGESSVGYGRTA